MEKDSDSQNGKNLAVVKITFKDHSLKRPSESLDAKCTLKKPRSFSFDAVLRDNMVESIIVSEGLLLEVPSDKEQPVQNYIRPITSRDTEFAKGKWAYVDVWNLDETVLVDCDDPEWTSVIETVKHHLDHSTDQKNIIKSVIALSRKYIHEIKSLRVCKKDKLDCRHFATISTVLFSKLFFNKVIGFAGSIQQLTADLINSAFEITEGHVWNVVRFVENGVETFWYVDVANGDFVNMSESNFLRRLTLHKVNQFGTCIELPLENDQKAYELVKLSKEKLSVGKTNKRHIEDTQKFINEVILPTITKKYPLPKTQEHTFPLFRL